MLKTLSIKNIALIDKLDLELKDGLNILSGETGAGKSIIIDSLNFVLGERADKTLISYGSNYADVQATFENYENPNVINYLNDIGIEPEEILILTRKMNMEGKNECRINGKTTTLSMLKGLTELLVDIHGQHQHQSLLKPQNHGILLDTIGSHTIAPLLLDVENLYNEYHDLLNKYKRFGNTEDRERKMDILKYQIDEIEKAEIYDGEEDELLEKRKKIRNLEKILEALNFAKNSLDGYDSSSITVNLKSTSSQLDSISQYDERVKALCERLENCKLDCQDIAYTCSDMIEELNFDSVSADQIEERLELVRNLQRKYGGSYDALEKFLKDSKEEYDLLLNAADTVLELEKDIANTEHKLIKVAKALTNERKQVAEKLEKAIVKELSELGMAGSDFKVDFITDYEPSNIMNNGADTIEFLISPNKGQPLKPLAKIISGGEMSRFMLAIKSILAEVDSIGTMVFDEIDTGISGHISAVVAEKMCNISRNRQVIAVTHMPSLAAMADTHFLITKSTVDNQTHTDVKPLVDDTDEIARLIGGSDYSEHAVPHAKEMKEWARKFKESK